MHLHHYALIFVLVAPYGAPPDLRGPAYDTPDLRGPAYGAQKPATPQQKPPAETVGARDLGVSLDRIQKALANTPKLRFDEQDRPIFRVQVFGAQPTIDDILGPDWATGPVKHGAMTHQEFLAMVTPKDMRGFSEYTNAEGAQLAASSFLLQWTLQKAIRKFRETEDAREREAARQEVIEALNALEAARAKTKK